MKERQSFEEYLRERHGLPSYEGQHRPEPTGGPARVSAVEKQGRHRQGENGKERNPRWRWHQKRIWPYGVLASILILVLLLCFLPISLGTVIVEGNQKMSADEVYRVACINRPINVMQLSTADIQKRLTGDLRIARADVSRELPLTIRIRMREREPLAIVHTDFGYAVLDAEGLVIAHMESIRDTQAAFVTGDNFGNVVLGDRLRHPLLLKALHFLGNLSAEGRREISEVNISDGQQIVAYTRDNLPIHLGAGEHMNEQAPLSENMIKDIRARKLDARFVDANIGAPYIKLK